MALAKTMEQFSAAPSTTTDNVRTPHFYDLLIRDDPRLDETIVAGEHHVGPIQQLLTLAVSGAALYGIAVGLAAQFLQVQGSVGEWHRERNARPLHPSEESAQYRTVSGGQLRGDSRESLRVYGVRAQAWLFYRRD